MKELCIIGDSNGILKTGYARIVKNHLGAECEVYALGSSTSLFPLFTLLENDIIGRYRQVVVSCMINETADINEHWLNRETVAAYLDFIIKLFAGSESRLVFLILPYNIYPYFKSSSYLYRAFSEIYNLELIDIEKDFRLVENKSLKPDLAHVPVFYQEYIARRILEICGQDSIQPLVKIPAGQSIEFSLLNLRAYEPASKFQTVGTSLLKRTVLPMAGKDIIAIPPDKYICGILYWNTASLPFLKFKNDSVTFVKNMNLQASNAFFCRSVGYSFFDGIKGPAFISSCKSADPYMLERTAFTVAPKTIQDIFYLSAVLICDRPPVSYGFNFIKKHQSVFDRQLNYLNKLYLDRVKMSFESTFRKFMNVLNDETIFNLLANQRPDIVRMHANPEGDIAQLFLWLWTNGANELKLNAVQRENLLKAILALAKLKASTAFIPAWSKLFESIYRQRKDLAYINTGTEEGQNQFVQWFDRFGKYEYNLDGVM